MLILISCLLLFITAFALLVLQVTRPNARYTWLVAVGGALLAFGGAALVWEANRDRHAATQEEVPPAHRPGTRG